MVFVLGMDLAPRMRVNYAIRLFEGIGPSNAEIICRENYIHPLAKMQDLSSDQLDAVKSSIQTILEKYNKEKMDRLNAKRKLTALVLKWIPRTGK